ncbi:MAG: SDR family oxidoreductase [Rhodoglobus sp.]
MKNIVVFGANGPTGRLLVEQALEQGNHVTAVTRRPDDFPISHDHVAVLAGDVHNRDDVDRAVAGQDAVLSALGVPFGREAVTVYSDGITHILAAMHSHDVRRLVCVSSSATEPNPRPQGGFFFEKVLQPFVVGVLGRTVYADMRRMEALVAASELDWTIVRPSGLFNSAEVSAYRTDEGHTDGRYTSRADLAAAMLRQLDDDSYSRRIVAVATDEGQPTMFQLITSEGLKKS